MHEEYELKLALSPEQLEKLPRNPLLRALTHDRKAPIRLFSTYYDTPAGLLHKRAMALRVRRAGRTRTQTLKVKANGTSGLQHFQEYESPLPGDGPDLNRVDSPQLKAMFEETGLAAQIGPVFTTDFARRKIRVRLSDSEIEVALDRGTIRSGDNSMPICEAELELVSGNPARIYELALALRDSVAFRLEFRTKAGRGYALAMNAPARPVTGAKPALTHDLTASRAWAAIAHACRDQIQGNEPAVLNGPGGDPEGVHQMRVGIRRLRAAIRTFQPILDAESVAYLKAELSWMQGELGPARDWDVFATETLPPVQAALPDEAAFSALVSASEAARRQAYDRAHTAIADPRYVRLLLRLNLWLQEGTLVAGRGEDVAPGGTEPVTEFAARALRHYGKKLRKAGRNHTVLSAEELHDLRIKTKKLRYAIEFFRGLHSDRAVKKTLSALIGVQDALGAMNDSVTCHRLLKDLRVRAALSGNFGKPLTERALGLVAGWQAATLAHRTHNFADLWSAYRKSKVFWS